MKQEHEIKALVDDIKSSQTHETSFDEAAILSEYRHKEGAGSGLAVKLLIIFGGFLATLAFLGFIMIAGLYESGVGSLLFGIICIACAIWLNRTNDKLIIDTFSITLFASGFFLIGSGTNQLNINENFLPLVFIVISVCSLLITQNYIISFISILVINGSIIALIDMHKMYPIMHVYTAFLTAIMVFWFLKEAKIISSNKKWSRLYLPIRMGLVISFISALFVMSKKEIFSGAILHTWITSIFTISATLYVVFILCRFLHARNAIIYIVTSLLLLVSTAMNPAISGSILVILLGFYVNHKTGFAIGVLSFIYFVSQYYYDLQFTLLMKSYMMFVTGILFMLLYLFTYKKLGSGEEV